MVNESTTKYITGFELDQLKEVVNIGASHASTALSQMIDKRIKITVPEAYVDRVEKISKFIGDGREVVTAVLLKVLEDAQGMMIFVFPRGSDLKLARLIEDRHSESEILDELDRSALKEVGNILAGASLTAFSRFLDVNILHSVSEVVTDMLAPIVNTIITEISHTSNIALIFKVDFEIVGADIKTSLFFFVDPKTTAKLLELTKKKVV
jgi:chemotaxis protein CheC